MFFANFGKKLNQKLVSCEISLTNQQSESMFNLKTNQNENLEITQKPKSKYSEDYSNLQNFVLKNNVLFTHSIPDIHSEFQHLFAGRVFADSLKNGVSYFLAKLGGYVRH